MGSPLVVAADRRSPTGRRTALLIGLALALLVGVLAVVDAGTGERAKEAAGEGTTTTRRERRSSTTRSPTATSEVRPFTSPISLPAGTRLLAWTPSGEFDALDPAAGSVTRLGPDGILRSDFGQVVPRLGGVVVVTANSQALWLPGLDGPAAPVHMASNVGMVFPSDVPGRVWISTFGEQEVVREIDLATVQPTASIPLPFDTYLQGVVDGGVVVGTSDGLYLRRRDAERFQRIVHGTFVASSGNQLAYRGCDDELNCGLYVHDLTADRSRPLGPAIEGWPQWGAFSPDGRWLAVVYVEPAGNVAELAVIDVTSGDLTPFVLPPMEGHTPTAPVWTSGGEWLLWPDGRGIAALHPADGTTATIDIDVVYGGIAVVGPSA